MTTRPDFPPGTDQDNPNLPVKPEDLNEITQKALSYRVLGLSTERVNRSISVLQKNLGGQRLGLFDLPRLTLRPTDHPMWVIPTAGDPVMKKSIEGIIVEIAFPRAYWKNSINEGRTPPNCSSPDGIKGYGDPSGECHACAFNQWGTSQTGSRTGKACREQRLLFLLQPDDIFPTIIQVPPTSLDVVKDYCLALANEDLMYTEVFTALSLATVDNGGNPYNMLVMTKTGQIPEDHQSQLDSYINKFIPLVGAPTYTPETGQDPPETNQQPAPNPAMADAEKETERTDSPTHAEADQKHSSSNPEVLGPPPNDAAPATSAVGQASLLQDQPFEEDPELRDLPF